MTRVTPFRLNGWQVDPASDTITNSVTCIKLDPRPMQVLVVLAQRAGEVLSPREIETAVWADVTVTTNSVYQCLTQLRKALGDDPKQPQYIQTIARKGYRLIARVEWQAPSMDDEQRAASSASPLETVSRPALASQRNTRRWGAFGVGGAFALLVAISLGIEAKRIADARTLAQHERARAEQISKFMLDVFTASDPYVTAGRTVSVRELLDRTARDIDAAAELQPIVRTQMLEMIARSYRGQCLDERAVPILERALQLRRKVSAGRPETGSLLLELAAALRSVGRFAAADRAFDEAVEIRAANAAQSTNEYARLVKDLEAFNLARGDPAPQCK